jgi:hypothetical protein
MRSCLPLALLLPLALACELKDADSGTDASDGSQGSTADATAASDPLTTTADPSAATTTATTATTATTMATTATTDATTDATTSTTSASGPTSDTDTTADPSATTGGVDADEAATQLCVDTINMYRATLGLPALARWTEAEDCADAECLSDGMTGMAHGAFGMCGESAQNECPGWPGEPASMITGCLELMWNEGPGEDFQKHGHYINMSNPNYSRVACGFAPGMGGVWSVQNFQ